MHQTLAQKSHYRHDIDGLRAIAVLAIVMFHINDTWLPGGFTGVDVFFVISGFVITANLSRDLQRGTFSYKEFYRRRIRRIFPAMFACVAFTLAAAVAVMTPEDVMKTGWSGLATAISGANIYFTYLLDTSYFAADSHSVPLLHMWSLGVEEQFYLVWPTLILLLFNRRMLIPVLIGLAVASVFFGQALLWSGGRFLGADAYSFAYYMLPSRLFQLSVGGLCALLPIWLAPRSEATGHVAFGAGALLVAASMMFLNQSSPFPGLYAVPVTIGTALLIWAGQRRTFGYPVLASALFRHVGNISYSLYLWHWPVLAFLRYFHEELSLAQQLLSVPVMLVLAEASYHFVEKPFRQNTKPLRHVVGRMFAAPLVLLLVAVIGLLFTRGMGPWMLTDYPQQFARVGEVKPASSSATVCQRPKLQPEWLTKASCIAGPGEPTALLYGDSNAAHYIGFAGALSEAAGLTLRNFEHSACPPILTDPEPYVQTRYLASCRYSLEQVRPLLGKYDVVFLGASWPSYASRNELSFEQDVRDFVNFLTKHGTRVVLLAKLPIQKTFDPSCAIKRLKAPWINCDRAGRSPQRKIPFNDVLVDIALKDDLVRVIDPAGLLCDATQTCDAYENNIPLYFDSGHLNFKGSWILGKRYAESAESADILDFITQND